MHKCCPWQLAKYAQENELFLRSAIFLTFTHGSLHETHFDLAIQANFTATIPAIRSEIKEVLKKNTVPNR